MPYKSKPQPLNKNVPAKATRKVHHSPTMNQVDCGKLRTDQKLDIEGCNPEPMAKGKKF